LDCVDYFFFENPFFYIDTVTQEFYLLFKDENNKELIILTKISIWDLDCLFADFYYLDKLIEKGSNNF
jgi:hypothetical protein